MNSLTLGFIPLTDCAPLVVAEAKGFFADEGLDVTLSREASWATIRDKVTVGALDAAHMLAQADQWLTAINDVRLSLGAMLGISEDTPDELDPDHPYAAHLHVYRWLTEQQWLLVEELMG